MKLILGGVREGKTTAAIKVVAENDAYLVVMSNREANRAFQMAKEAGLEIRFPLTFAEFLRGDWHGKGCKGFVIDNADALLVDMAGGVPVVAITATTSGKDE